MGARAEITWKCATAYRKAAKKNKGEILGQAECTSGPWPSYHGGTDCRVRQDPEESWPCARTVNPRPNSIRQQSLL